MNKILIILLTLLGFNFNNNDLHRRNTWEDHKRNLNFWVTRNMDIVTVAVIIIGLIVFTIFCFMFVGVSSTDSGVVYNQFDKVI